MLFVPNGIPIEAIRFGDEPLPDWCRDFMAVYIEVIGAGDGESMWGKYIDHRSSMTIVVGDYICRSRSGRVFILSAAVFESLFTPLPQGTVFVNIDNGEGV